MATKKKSAKASSKKVSKYSLHTHSGSMKAIVSLLIILLAASIFFLFKQYQDNIVKNNMFYVFMSLTVIMMGLLVSLLFLINPSKKK